MSVNMADSLHHHNHHHHHSHHASPSNHASSSSRPHMFGLRDATPGSAYRSGHLAPPDFLVPPPPASHTYDRRREDDEPEERGISDAGRVIMPQLQQSQQERQMILAAGQGDEPPSYFWTFDKDGRPVISRYNLSKPSPNALPPAGNRGLKLRPLTSLDPHHDQCDPSSSRAPPVEPHRSHFRNCIPPSDPLIASHAPNWNAYGRLAPWTSGATGPLTGTGEEEVGPTGVAAGEEGEVGERRPRRGDRETNDRLRLRIAALQRAGVRSLLSDPPPRERGAVKREAREDSPLLLASSAKPPALRSSSASKQADHPQDVDSSDALYLSSSSLAPTLLQPVLSPLQLLQSRTLRHTFRNPHIGALAKTTLDLAEAEGDVVKAVGGFWAALEEDNGGKWGVKRGTGTAKEAWEAKKRAREEDQAAGRKKKRARPHRSRAEYSPSTVGTAGAGGGNAAAAAAANGGEAVPMIGAGGHISLDELNPTFYKLEDLFITREGLPIPVQPPGQEGGEGEQEGGQQQQQQQQQGQQQQEVIVVDGEGEEAAVQQSQPRQEDAQPPAQQAEQAIDGDSSMAAPEAEAAPAATKEEETQGQFQDGQTPARGGEAGAPSTEQPPTTAAPSTTAAADEQDVKPAGLAAQSASEANAIDGAVDTAAQPSHGPTAPNDEGRASAAPSVAEQGASQGGSDVPLTLPPTSQREILLASLSCLHDLASDSDEYLRRLEEVRGRLSEVKRKRDRIWRALREWAVKGLEEGEKEEDRADGTAAEGASVA